MMFFSLRTVPALLVVSALSACSSTSSFFSRINPFESNAFRPTELKDFKAELRPRLMWSNKVGDAQSAALQPAIIERTVFAASQDGVVTALDMDSGKQIWRRELKQTIVSGVAATGDVLILVADKGKVIALDENGKDLWTTQASTEVITPPAANLGNVVVRAADGRITAYDARDGKRKWSFQRQQPPLTLRSPEPVTILQGTAYAGYSGGKLLALNLNNGNIRWEASVALPKGATEIERISDVSGAPVVSLRQVCAATFQGRVGCFDLQTGTAVWTRDFSSTVGISADDRYVIGFTEKGAMTAFSRDGGAQVWRNEDYVFRKPQTPVVYGRSAIFSDVEGIVHWVGRDNGLPLARVSVSGGEASGPLVVADKRILLQTRGGYLSAIALD
jgi:outer membrane protein assembly factor BamB